MFGDMNCAIRTVQRLPKLKKRIVRPNFGDQISKHSKQGKNYKEIFGDKSFIRTNIYTSEKGPNFIVLLTGFVLGSPEFSSLALLCE